MMVRARGVLAVCAGVSAASFVPSREPNMNGEYPFATTPGGTPGLLPKQYRDYPGGVEFYDAYSPPMTTLYSQVWWKPLAPTDFPDEMVQKYKGKGMAIVGWEIDQVRRTPEGDVSVPINAHYNHHYVSQVVGGGARFKKIMLDGPDDPRAEKLRRMSSHGGLAYDHPHYIVEEEYESKLGPGKQSSRFANSNGGEYRKSFHGFAPGVAMIIDSPTQFQISPMQIDTWNRDKMNISKDSLSKFVVGPLPRSSPAFADAAYSGLLECPMTTRVTKVVDGGYLVRTDGSCESNVVSSQECFHAAGAALGQGDSKHRFVNQTVSDPNMAAGCTASVDPADPFKIRLTFNKFAATVGCAENAPSVAGIAGSLVEVGVNLTATDAVITLSGPATVWFGVGFGAVNMGGIPWTVVVDGDGKVTERKLANHAEGALLAPSVTVLSNSVAAGTRRVVLTRPLQGKSPDYYTFSPTLTDATIPFIDAVGSRPTFSYHNNNKTPSSLTLLPSGGGGACVCPEKPKPFGEASGKLVYNPVPGQKGDIGGGAVGFNANKCLPWPTSLLRNYTNPTCDIRHYQGGQWSCHHMWSLLDADQVIPWADQPITLYHKYRFWVQPYNASYHQGVALGDRVDMLIGSPWEYDIPKCAEGVPGCALENGTWVHTLSGGMIRDITLGALNFHCHAPACLSTEMWACPKGTPIPQCSPTTPGARVICKQEPQYGGVGNPVSDGTRFDEEGYIANPQCLWGSKEFGLEAPVNLEGLTLHVIKRCNATNAHFGEMAGGQPWMLAV